MKPLDYDLEMEQLVGRLFSPVRSADETVEKIFFWLKFNISYQGVALPILNLSFRKYKTALETFRTRKGCCLEQSYLLMVFSQLAGLETQLAYVDVDHQGKKVSHACVYHEGLLIDPSYGVFNIKHEKYRVITPDELVKDFSRFNGE